MVRFPNYINLYSKNTITHLFRYLIKYIYFIIIWLLHLSISIIIINRNVFHQNRQRKTKNFISVNVLHYTALLYKTYVYNRSTINNRILNITEELDIKVPSKTQKT